MECLTTFVENETFERQITIKEYLDGLTDKYSLEDDKSFDEISDYS